MKSEFREHMEKQGYKKESSWDLFVYAIIAVVLGIGFAILILLILI